MATKMRRAGVGGARPAPAADGALQTLADARATRSSEKKELCVLNDRFASYIEKVRSLQERNNMLATQVKIQQSKEPSNIVGVYEAELTELRALVEQLTREKARVETEKNVWQAMSEEWQGKCEMETATTEGTRTELTTLKKEVDAETVARVGFENQLTTAQEEIEFLKRVFEEERRSLHSQIGQCQALIESEVPVVSGPDISETLREIRLQYEIVGRTNRENAEVKYKQKFSDMAQQRERDNEALVAARAELTALKRQLQSIVGEIEALKVMSGSWEVTIAETEARMQKEIEEYKLAIAELERQIEKWKGEMTQHTVEYQELMDIKMALDVEIAAYKKLLEGEEMRLLLELK